MAAVVIGLMGAAQALEAQGMVKLPEPLLQTVLTLAASLGLFGLRDAVDKRKP
jgi:hypothetical protein